MGRELFRMLIGNYLNLQCRFLYLCNGGGLISLVASLILIGKCSQVYLNLFLVDASVFE